VLVAVHTCPVLEVLIEVLVTVVVVRYVEVEDVNVLVVDVSVAVTVAVRAVTVTSADAARPVVVSVNVICLVPGSMLVPAMKLPLIVPVLLAVGAPTM